MVRMPALALALAQAVTVLPTLLACGANAKPAATAKLPVPDAALRRDPGPSGGSPVGASDLARGAGAPSAKPDEVGLASWYGDELNGRKTASGERFDARTMSAAHRKLPFGTWIEVRRVDTGRSVRVRVNDRGPFSSKGGRPRVVDVSKAAAEQLDMIGAGVVRVELRVVPGP